MEASVLRLFEDLQIDDLDLAFQLQLQEAIVDSLSFHTSVSTATIPEVNDSNIVINLYPLQKLEQDESELERRDRLLNEIEMRKDRVDVSRGFHDLNFGDDYVRAFGEGSSSSSSSLAKTSKAEKLETFKIYFRSFVSDSVTKKSKAPFGAIGFAILDSRDNLIVESGKEIVGSDRSHTGTSCLALVEALNAALSRNLLRVEVYHDCFALFQHIRGRWKPKQLKIKELVSQVSLLRKQFTSIEELYIPRKHIKFEFKLAQDVVLDQINNSPETCQICYLEKPKNSFLQIDSCSHSYCFSCMTLYMETQLLSGMLPQCPYQNCKSELKIESCKVFLPDKLIELMRHQIEEASIPTDEKLYCPFPKCSALMSKMEVLENPKFTVVGCSQNGARRCVKCESVFCINCKVPWHKDLTCTEYKVINPGPSPEEAKLKILADKNKWKQCKKCYNMVERVQGCCHITCRCGNEFCYICGANWVNMRGSCSCLIFDALYILEEDEDESGSEEMWDDLEEDELY